MDAPVPGPQRKQLAPRGLPAATAKLDAATRPGLPRRRSAARAQVDADDAPALRVPVLGAALAHLTGREHPQPCHFAMKSTRAEAHDVHDHRCRRLPSSRAPVGALARYPVHEPRSGVIDR
jgi:hypothetical protein